MRHVHRSNVQAYSAYGLIACLVILHLPDGTAVRFDTRISFGPYYNLPPGYTGAVKGSKTVLNASGQRWFVTETAEEIDQMKNECGED